MGKYSVTRVVIWLGLVVLAVHSTAFASDLYLFDLRESKATSISKLQKAAVPFAEDKGGLIFKLVDGDQITFGQLTYDPQARLVRIAFGHPKELQFLKSYKQFAAFSDKLVAKLGNPSLDSLMNLVTAETYRQSRSEPITPQEAIATMKDNEATWERVWETSKGIYILKLAKHGGAHNAVIVVEDNDFFKANRGLGPSPNERAAEKIVR